MVKNNRSKKNLQPAGKHFLFIAFFISGCASLIFEVIWTRILLLSIGATAVAVAAVLSAFMAGMAVGSFLAGRRFVLRFNPILTYGLLEGWIGLYSLFTPYFMRLTAAASPAVQFGFAVIVILPATIAMGASLPILSRVFSGDSPRQAGAVGRLYAANTIGAFAGPLISVFWLFPAYGLNRTLHIAAAADFLVFIGIFFSRKLFFNRESTARMPVEPALSGDSRADKLLRLTMAISGAAAMIYEVAWTRVLSTIYGSSIYGVSIMLATFLVGIAAGSALAAAWLHRRKKQTTLTVVAVLLAGAALTAFLSLLFAREFPFLFINIYNSLPPQNLTLFFSQFVISLLLMLPATLCLGAMLPTAVSVSAANFKSEIGLRVSRLYTANLVGSALGTVIAAGLLIGKLGIGLSLRGAALLAILTALVLILSKRKNGFPAVTTALLAGAFLFILAINPEGEAVTRGFGFYTDPHSYDRYDTAGMRNIAAIHKLLYYRDGPTATVSVQEIDRYVLLKINGKTDASNGTGDINTQLLLGHLPLMANPAGKVAVIGLGSGMTAGAVLSHPVEAVDVFEIEPAVVEASHFFDDLNGKPLNDPRLRLFQGDARSILKRRKKSYDLIISEPSNPWITGVANLFTRDFFSLAASRLKEEGILSQWFHLYGMSEESTRSLIATFRSVFPHTLVFKDRDLILLGSRRPLRFDIRRMQHLFTIPRVRDNLALTFIRFPFDLLINLRLDEKGAADFSDGAALNTDDNLMLELAAPRSLYHNRIETIKAKMAQYSASVIDHVTGYTSLSQVYFELAASHFTAGNKEKALRLCRQSLNIAESFDSLKLLGQILQGLGLNREAREVLKKALLLSGANRDRRIVEALLRSLESSDKPGR